MKSVNTNNSIKNNIKLIIIALILIFQSILSFSNNGDFPYKVTINIKLPSNFSQYLDSSTNLEFNVRVYNVGDNQLIQEFVSKSNPIELGLSRIGVYSVKIEVYSNDKLIFQGADSFVLTLLNFYISREVEVLPVLTDVLITFKSYKRLPEGVYLELTNPDYNEGYQIDISGDVTIQNFPEIIKLKPGRWFINISQFSGNNVQNDNVPDSSTTDNNQSFIRTPFVITVTPGVLNSFMVEIFEDTFEIKPNAAFFTKLLSVSKSASYTLLTFKQGRFQGKLSIDINGVLTNSAEKTLVSGIQNVTAYFENGSIMRLEYPAFIPENIRVLLSSKFTSSNASASAIFNEVNLSLQNQYELSVCEQITKSVYQIKDTSSQWRVYESNGSLFISNSKVTFGPFSRDTVIFLDAKSPESRFRVSGRSNSYEGSIEIRYNSSSRGFTIVNELPLERYLIYVVGSEMPSSYALEALKAQAVAARSYALDKILRTRTYISTGANLDDSTNFQAYNISAPYPNAFRAVEETKHRVLTFNQVIANTYYYATSGGIGFSASDVFGTDAAYLTSRVFAITNLASETRTFVSEDEFLSFLKTWNSKELKEAGFLEAEHPFFRWRVEFTPDELIKRIDGLTNVKKVKKENPQIGTTLSSIWDILNPSSSAGVMNMYVSKRGNGGYVMAITIETSDSYITVSSSDVRRLLNVSGKTIFLQNGTKRTDFASLPSMFFAIDTQKNSDYVEKIIVYGGGFGHGVGLSQVGANSLAKNYNFNFSDILEFFYPGTNIANYFDYLIAQLNVKK
ncbi:SpoIID/LytB domain-containing protein [Fervidobacterium sp.]